MEKLRYKIFDKRVYPNGLEKIGGSKSDWVDLRCATDVSLIGGQLYYIPLGVAIELPKGYEALVVPRSSTAKNFGVLQANSIGVVDESYCGDNDEWHFPVLAYKDTTIKRGERVCQFRIIEHQPELDFEEVDLLYNEDRGGLGSTGKN